MVLTRASSVLLGAGELQARTLFGGCLILLAGLLAAGSTESISISMR
ncbi:MAG: hypothetical protein H7346_06410 [Burkholderiaceae bacterium]|nr:hypothetical protein [Burkholderiaceae bacterium]